MEPSLPYSEKNLLHIKIDLLTSFLLLQVSPSEWQHCQAADGQGLQSVVLKTQHRKSPKFKKRSRGKICRENPVTSAAFALCKSKEGPEG